MNDQLSFRRYRDLKSHLKEKYGETVHRIPMNAGFGCPHRDAQSGLGGCIYCDSTGSGFSVDKSLSITQQIEKRIRELEDRGIRKFIAYFQAGSNTYGSLEKLEEIYRSVLIDGVVALDVSTRPDLVPDEVLALLDSFSSEVDVILELGLQSVNNSTLRRINRKHSLADFIDAVVRARKYKLELVAHVITNLPWDSTEDVIECARILSSLGVDGVKMHSLYVVKDSPLGQYGDLEFLSSITLDDFIFRTVEFLDHLDPGIVIHRLVSDPPREGVVFGNWGLPKIVILNEIQKRLVSENRYQGRKCSLGTCLTGKRDEWSRRFEESPDSSGRDAG